MARSTRWAAAFVAALTLAGCGGSGFTPGGTSACDPNPCMGGGYCSWLINRLGELVTSCIRPL